MNAELVRQLRLVDFTERVDGKNPWDRHEYENDRQLQWFEYFLRFNPRKISTLSRVCALWCSEYNHKFDDKMRKDWEYAARYFYWKERKGAYWKNKQKTFDDRLTELAQFHAEEFTKYAEHLKVQEWEKSQEMMAIADHMLKLCTQMLEIPIVEEEVVEDEDGIKVIISPTSNFRVADIPAMARAAAKITEVASALGKVAVQHIAESIGRNPKNVDDMIDLSQLSEQDLEALKFGATPKQIKDKTYILEELRAEHIRKNQ